MKILLVLILALICIAPYYTFSSNPYKKMPYDQIVDDLITRSSKRLEKKHNMRLVGITEGMMGSVKLIGFSFQIFRQMKKNEARTMVVDCVQDLLADINQEEKIRPYLEVFPFDTNHVEIFLFIDPIDEVDCHPNLSVVTASHRKIYYNTNDSEKKYKFKCEEEETFEDAVKILKGEIPVPASNIK